MLLAGSESLIHKLLNLVPPGLTALTHSSKTIINKHTQNKTNKKTKKVTGALLIPGNLREAALSSSNKLTMLSDKTLHNFYFNRKREENLRSSWLLED